MSTDDLKVLGTFELFLRETPDGLTETDPEAWPDMFISRLAFEAWRERWLPYWAGMSDEPTDPQEYATLRPRLWSHPRTERVDRFHS